MILQTGGGIWWASSIHSSIAQIDKEFTVYVQESSAENLRQWARINSNESSVQSVESASETTKAIVQRIERDLSGLKGELTNLNALLREMLVENATNRRAE